MTGRFRGSYDARMDDRGRVKIPAKFLSVFDDSSKREVFITSINGDSAMIYPLPVWEEMEEKFENLGSWDPDVDEFITRLSYWGTETEIDSKGRLLIPTDLRKEGQLEETVLIFGKGNHLVAWNKELFKAGELGEKYSKEKLHRVSRIINEAKALPGNE